MANTEHPLDIHVDNQPRVRRLLIQAFLQSGNEIDPYERVALDAVDDDHGQTRGYRLREVACDKFKRNGDSRVTRDALRDAGYGLIDLTAERNARTAHTKIVQLFPDQHNAG